MNSSAGTARASSALLTALVFAITLVMTIHSAVAQPAAADGGGEEPVLEAADNGSATGQGARPTGSPPPNNDSPFDYKASEKISEDLSVSFPVDI